MYNRSKSRKRNRLEDYDYSQHGYYFITSCVDNYDNCLGDFDGNEMKLNEYGEIVKQQWLWLSKQYSYVELDEFVVMPNHFHGILIINNDNDVNHHSVGTGRDLSLHCGGGKCRCVKIKPLWQLIGAFKTTSSKLIHIAGYKDFKWQRSFHDRVINSEKGLDNIRNYIITNEDKYLLD